MTNSLRTGKSPRFMGKSTILMVDFHSDVKLPEGMNSPEQSLWIHALPENVWKNPVPQIRQDTYYNRERLLHVHPSVGHTID